MAGGAEFVSLVWNEAFNSFRARDPWLEAEVPGLYASMLETAENVARRYGVTRQAQDEYAADAQTRTAAGTGAGAFDQEIVALPTTKIVLEADSSPPADVQLEQDEGNRPSTTVESLGSLTPVLAWSSPDPDACSVTAGDASQLSDGAAAVALMDFVEASRRELPVLGAFRGMAVSGCEPDEMGIGPVIAVPKLLDRHRLKVADIDLWELDEAFASQAL